MTVIALANDALRGILKDFICPQQIAAIREAMRGPEATFFAARMVELAEQIKNMPKTGEQSGKQVFAHLHYFIKGIDIYITEKDMGDGSNDTAQYQAFGYQNIGFGFEAGYVCLPEIFASNTELDLHFKPTPIEDLID